MRHVTGAALLFCLALPLHAEDIQVTPSCTATATACQRHFQDIAEDLVTLIDYKAGGPAEATGLTGFGIGAVFAYVEAGEGWQPVTGEDFSGLPLAGLQVTKGLPLNLDVGAFYASAPEIDVAVFGGEVRYAFLPGSTTTPALALRASYVKTSGIDDFEVDSTAAELALSKGFGPVTPFVGAGYVWGTATPDGSTGLSEAEVEDTKAYAGVRLSLGLFEITPQVGAVGDNVNYVLRLGFSI